MPDYDVIVIGGGINGLCCSAYLGKAGLKTLVLEARGECGAHCDTSEPGIPGFLYNLHATMLATGFGPPMQDLELEKYGLELRNTSYVWGKPFLDGTNALIGSNPYDTMENWGKHSKQDRALLENALEFLYPQMLDFTDIVHRFMYTAPNAESMQAFSDFMGRFFKHMGKNVTGEQFMKMNGFEVMDAMFESDHIKTMVQAMEWIIGFPPIHPQIGAIGSLMGLLSGSFFPLTTAKGGSHAVTHALIQANVASGVKIMPCCPVKKILMKNGEAQGVVLHEHAIYPNQEITAKKIVSNITVVPTFIDLIGEDHISDKDLVKRIKNFNYHEQTIFTVHYALSGPPQWRTADFDEGIMRSWMGYFGGETTDEMKKYAQAIIDQEIYPEIYANWYLPTLADPTQAPAGCHVTQAWIDMPGEPLKWKHGQLGGKNSFLDIKNVLADQITDAYERYAPGFKKQILNRYIYSPLEQERNNPSAIQGCWAGGSVIPEQFYDKRPVPGVCVGGGSRTFLKNLYLSNSIHPFGITPLGSGYIAACEVAEDMGAREQEWWTSKATHWYLENAANIPLDLGVRRSS
ncbi:MAG: NAD(P)/FAD-dependent oxidoreductase [Desulfobacterales bacterium]|nr:NAD(P)/FAD-dependent oxidoreductase [Desulfobacterales bacterium]